MSQQGQCRTTCEGGSCSGAADKANLDNHGNQCNPNHPEFKGHQSGYSGEATPSDLNNHSNQLNPNNPKCQSKKC